MGDLEVFAAGANVDETSLRDRGLIKGTFRPHEDPRRRRAHEGRHRDARTRSRKAAAEKIAKAGGKVNVGALPSARRRLRQPHMSAFSGFANIGKVPELRKRVLFTLGMLAVYRVGVFVTIPGVDRNVMQAVVLEAGRGASSASSTCSAAAPWATCRSSRSASCRTSARASSCSSSTMVCKPLDELRKEGEQGTAEDQPVHALRDDRPLDGPGLRHGAEPRGPEQRRPRRHRRASATSSRTRAGASGS